MSNKPNLYAFDEINNLISDYIKFDYSQGKIDTNRIRYICALIAELSYYNIPHYELDNMKRSIILNFNYISNLIKKFKAKSIPSIFYKKYFIKNTQLNTIKYLKNRNIETPFIIEDKNLIVVAIKINNFLFLGYRGTRFFFDWKINFNSKFANINNLTLHRGFTEEAYRISIKIVNEINKIYKKKNRHEYFGIEHIFLSGHSLGGAVAAISKEFLINYLDLKHNYISTYIYGSPRYGDISYYIRNSLPPIQIQRYGDIVPHIPPKKWGYADHPNVYNTDGTIYINESNKRMFLSWFSYLYIKNHYMEIYRKELGETINCNTLNLPLIDLDKLTISDINNKKTEDMS